MSKTRRVVLLGLGAAATAAAGGVLGLRVMRDRHRGPPGLPPFLTDASLFYDRHSAKRFDPRYHWTRLSRPDLIPPVFEPPPGPFALRIEGAVAAPMEIDERDLTDAAARGLGTGYLKTMRCSGDAPDNRLVSNGLWEGVPLTWLLHQAQVRPEARRLRLHALDGFTTNLRLDALNAPDGRPALLATRLNGSALPFERGGPVRVLAPGRYGFKSPKWIGRIEVVAEDESWGNHEIAIRGGTDDGGTFVGLKVLDPAFWGGRPRQRVALGAIDVVGLALPGAGAINAVRGRWTFRGADTDLRATVLRPAELDIDPVRRVLGATVPWPLPDVWVPFRLTFGAAERGVGTLVISATDDAGGSTQSRDTTRIDGDGSEITLDIEVA